MLIMGKRRYPWGEGWSWPVPDMYDPYDPARLLARAEISQEFRPAGSARPHLGVDIMFHIGGGWQVPESCPVLAARGGTVWSTGHTARGWNVVIDHGVPFAAFYQHLSAMPLVRAGQLVNAGDRIGTVGADPTDPEGLRHLHFAVWYKGHGDAASIDPAPVMSSWARSRWTP